MNNPLWLTVDSLRNLVLLPASSGDDPLLALLLVPGIRGLGSDGPSHVLILTQYEDGKSIHTISQCFLERREDKPLKG